MPIPLFLPLAAVAAAAIGAFALSKSSSSSSSGGPQTQASIVCDAGMPADDCQAVMVALNTETDPQKLRTAASVIPQFPIASAALLARAIALEALLGIQPLVPPNVPIAPPAQPSPVPQPIPAFPPVILPSAPISPALPAVPPTPVAPAAPAAPANPSAFDPGEVPVTVRPYTGNSRGQQNTDIQRALSNFFAQTAVVYPDNGGNYDPGFTLRDPSTGNFNNQLDSDGVWGPKSQLSLWAFQTWANTNMGSGLAVDGLPGPASASALDPWM